MPDDVGAWLSEDPDRVAVVEDQLAQAHGLEPGELLVDYPARSAMLGVDLPLVTRGGGIERLTDAGRSGQLGLPQVAVELYRSARRLRIFTARPVGLKGIPTELLGD